MDEGKSAGRADHHVRCVEGNLSHRGMPLHQERTLHNPGHSGGEHDLGERQHMGTEQYEEKYRRVSTGYSRNPSLEQSGSNEQSEEQDEPGGTLSVPM